MVMALHFLLEISSRASVGFAELINHTIPEKLILGCAHLEPAVAVICRSLEIWKYLKGPIKQISCTIHFANKYANGLILIFCIVLRGWRPKKYKHLLWP